MTDFYNSEAVLERKLKVPENLESRSSKECEGYYEISRCIEWIRDNSFKKVCLQFPDHLLPDSRTVALAFQNTFDQVFYILGDTSYESCCVDYIAAAHIEADAIIHFGPACLSKPAEKVPCLYIYEKLNLDCTHLKDCIFKEISEDGGVIVILDIPYVHLLNLCSESLLDLKVSVVSVTKLNEICFGKEFVVFVGESERKLMDIDVLTSDESILLFYEPKTLKLSRYSQNTKLMKRRYFLVEKIKDSKVVGILIGTLAIKDYLKALDRMKKLLRAHGKKYYIIVVGKPTVAKLANFAEIELFVLISCSMNEVYDDREFYQPIVTPLDVEVALNPNYKSSKFTYDYNSYLSTAENLEITDDFKHEIDVSLITGRVRNSTENVKEEGGDELVEKQFGALALSSNYGAGFLAERSWQGLEQNLGLTEVKLAEEGRKGIAGSYENEPS